MTTYMLNLMASCFSSRLIFLQSLMLTNLPFPGFHGHLQLAHLGPVVQHSITSKRNRQAQKSLENNEPLYYLQELSKDVERYNYIKVKQTLCKFSLFIYLPKSSYSLAASSSLSSATFSPKPVNFLPKTPCPLFPSSESVIFF